MRQLCRHSIKGNKKTDAVKISTSSAAKSVSTWNGVMSILLLASAFLADCFGDLYSTHRDAYICSFFRLSNFAFLQIAV